MLVRRLLLVPSVFLVAGCGHTHRAAGTLVRFRVVGHATAADLDRTVEIVRHRIDDLGLRDAALMRTGRVISIRLSGGTRRELAPIIGKQGVLEFYDFEADLAPPSVSGLNGTPVAKANLRDLLGGAKRVPRNTVVVTCDNRSHECPTTVPGNARTGFFLFKHIAGKVPEMTGRDLQESTIRADVDPTTNQPIVVFQFTQRGKRIFREIIRREAHRGQLMGNCLQSPPASAQHFAIVLDRQIESAPYIDYCKNPDGIPGDNGAQIDFGSAGSIGAAKRVALVLRTGALPVRLVRIR